MSTRTDIRLAALDPYWRDRAMCRDANPMLFCTTDGESRVTPPIRAIEAGRQYCANCPVVAECGIDADRNQDEGLRGGVWRFLSESGRYTGNRANTTQHGYVASAPAAHHVRGLISQGWTRKDIATAAGVSDTSVTNLLNEPPRIQRRTANAILGVHGRPSGLA